MKNINFTIKKFILIISFSFLSINTLANPHTPRYVMENEITKSTDEETSTVLEANEQNLEEQFLPILEELFSNRNACILASDLEGLKTHYNLKIKVSLWAYESEAQKIKYFQNWSEKQGVKGDTHVGQKQYHHRPRGFIFRIYGDNNDAHCLQIPQIKCRKE